MKFMTMPFIELKENDMYHYFICNSLFCVDLWYWKQDIILETHHLCPSTIEITLKDMGKFDQYHSRTKCSKTDF